MMSFRMALALCFWRIVMWVSWNSIRVTLPPDYDGDYEWSIEDEAWKRRD